MDPIVQGLRRDPEVVHMQGLVPLGLDHDAAVELTSHIAKAGGVIHFRVVCDHAQSCPRVVQPQQLIYCQSRRQGTGPAHAEPAAERKRRRDFDPQCFLRQCIQNAPHGGKIPDHSPYQNHGTR